MANWLARAQVLADNSPVPANERIAPNLRLASAPPSAEIEQELRDLIGVILAGDSESERIDTLAIALAEPHAALVSFRELAKAIPARAVAPRGGQRTCSQCAELSGRGECRVVARGESIGILTGRSYRPIADMPLRCAGYQPKADDDDRRPGYERWPGLLPQDAAKRCA